MCIRRICINSEKLQLTVETLLYVRRRVTVIFDKYDKQRVTVFNVERRVHREPDTACDACQL